MSLRTEQGLPESRHFSKIFASVGWLKTHQTTGVGFGRRARAPTFSSAFLMAVRSERGHEEKARANTRASRRQVLADSKNVHSGYWWLGGVFPPTLSSNHFRIRSAI